MFDEVFRRNRLKGGFTKLSPVRIAINLVVAVPLVIFASTFIGQLKRMAATQADITEPARLGSLFYDAALETILSARVLLDNEPIPQDSPLPAVRLRIEPGSLERMASNIPDSIKARYYPASMLYPDGQWRRVSYRLRGRNHWHWDLSKPSLRVKLRREAPINLQRRINLVNPEDRAMISNIMSEAVGTDMGVLTHQTDFVRVFLNGDYYGVYHRTTQDDESWLRLMKRFPGPIFIGERLAPQWVAEQFDKAGDLDVLEHIQPMQRMISAINQKPHVGSVGELWDILSKAQYARWMAAMAVTGSIHADFSHNQLFYFDPTKGRLEPVMSDVNGYDIQLYPRGRQRLREPWELSFDTPLNGVIQPLSNVALRDPHFRHVRNVSLHEAINGVASVDNQHRKLDEYARLIDRDALADRRKGAISGGLAGWKRFPYDNRQYRETQRQVRQWIVDRNRFLGQQLQDTVVTVRLVGQSGSAALQMVVEVTGNAAARFDVASLGVRLAHDRNGDGSFETETPPSILLHPGLAIATKGFHPRISPRTASPSHMIEPGTERYQFSIGAGEGNIADKLSGAFLNAVTGSAITPKIVTDATGAINLERNGVSLHPWTFARQPSGQIRLGPGVVELKQDLHIAAGQSLFVEPGTTLLLGPGVSILSRGKAHISGSEDRPVILRRLDPSMAWGAIVIQGETSAGSMIRHAEISGGSWARAFNVRYSGMVSVHWSHDVQIQHTRIDTNTLSDDTLHIVSSRFVLDDLQFVDCFSDCIDLDYASGSIARLEIENSRNDGLDLMTSKVSLSESRISHSGDKGISIGENSELDIDGLKVDNAMIGLAVKDRSTVNLRNAQLARNHMAIDIFHKNWRFGAPGSIEIARTEFSDNQVNVRVEEGGLANFVDRKRPDRVVGDGRIEQLALRTGL